MELDKSENAGLKVARLFGDLEQRILANRKKVFINAIKSGDFKSGVNAERTNFRNNNIKDISEFIPNIKKLVNDEITASVEMGIMAVEKTISTYEKQGKEFEQPQADFKATVQNRSEAITLAGILSVLTVMLTGAEKQLDQITSLVDTTKDLYAEVDRVQSIFLEKGITGKILANGAEKEAYSEVEFLMRDFSHKTLLEAQGETAKAYGMQPLVRVSAHPSSCPLCSPWQDAILIDDVYQGGIADGKHELLSKAISAGLGHYNCRHNWVNYVEGLDEPKIFQQDKQSKLKTAQNYAMEQRQREIERTIRKYKRIENASLTNEKSILANQKVAEWQAVQRELVKTAKANDLSIYRQYSREQIDGGTKPLKRV